ncbi:DUF5004 domain-containing protein [Tamlana sp. I1]|uniref:DUF5004 domain-containing protein n=1 Tax=Tamlana sp. I1 TaxID=2762061 RepID=UPI00188F690F|nr:DUF5004 domain-containing protein [Tamlana sp. I1]
MKKPFFLATLIAINLLVFSCNSNDDNLVCDDPITGELSDKETEFSGEWVLKSVVSDEPIDLTNDDVTNPSTNIYAQYPACLKDNIYNFKSDRDYTFLQGSTLSDCDNTIESDGTWQLSNGNTLTTVSYCSRVSLAIVINNEGTEFSYERSVILIDIKGKEIPSTLTTTFEKK